jgi:hypothetical protein
MCEGENPGPTNIKDKSAAVNSACSLQAEDKNLMSGFLHFRGVYIRLSQSGHSQPRESGGEITAKMFLLPEGEKHMYITLARDKQLLFC